MTCGEMEKIVLKSINYSSHFTVYLLITHLKVPKYSLHFAKKSRH